MRYFLWGRNSHIIEGDFILYFFVPIGISYSVFFFPEKMKSAREGIFSLFFQVFSRGEFIFLAHFCTNFLGHSDVFSGAKWFFFSGWSYDFSGTNQRIFSDFLQFSGGKFVIFFSPTDFFFSGANLLNFSRVQFFFSGSFQDFFSGTCKFSRAKSWKFSRGELFFSRGKKKHCRVAYVFMTKY